MLKSREISSVGEAAEFFLHGLREHYKENQILAKVFGTGRLLAAYQIERASRLESH
jgi:hypothetical protein